ncbi:hypothetical protein APHAL10511_002369 [Amanita phalloides]|nr:hypothetical protein APHAL10511_002369 [Amanita phalloides]
MQLASVIIVLIHLLYVTAWTGPTRLNDRLSPRWRSQRSRSKRPGPVQQAVESLRNRDYIGDVYHGRLYRLKKRFNGRRAVVKVTFSHDSAWEWHEELDAETIKDMECLERVEQFLGLGVMQMKGFEIHFIVMMDMGYTVEEMERKGVPMDVLHDAAVKAIQWYREDYAMKIILSEVPGVEDLKNFAFQLSKTGRVTARIIGWHSGKIVQGVTPNFTVKLRQEFPADFWHAQSFNLINLPNTR